MGEIAASGCDRARHICRVDDLRVLEQRWPMTQGVTARASLSRVWVLRWRFSGVSAWRSSLAAGQQVEGHTGVTGAGGDGASARRSGGGYAGAGVGGGGAGICEAAPHAKSGCKSCRTIADPRTVCTHAIGDAPKSGRQCNRRNHSVYRGAPNPRALIPKSSSVHELPTPRRAEPCVAGAIGMVLAHSLSRTARAVPEPLSA